MKYTKYLLLIFCLSIFAVALLAGLNYVKKKTLLPIDQKTLDEIRVGTPQDELLANFGPPYEKVELYGKKMWKYYSPPSAKMVYLQFDEEGKYESYDIDD